MEMPRAPGSTSARKPVRTPVFRRRFTRSRQLEGASPTRAASSLFQSRASFCKAARMAKSIRFRVGRTGLPPQSIRLTAEWPNWHHRSMMKPNPVRGKSLSFETLAVHAGREDFGEIGVHAPPLDLSTTYPTGNLADATASIDAMAQGGAPTGSFVYARFHNPTVARYEAALAALEGADASVAFASGLAA